MAISVWADYYILSFGTTVKIPFLLPTCLFTQKSSTRWLWTSHRVEDYGDAMFIRPISEVLSSDLCLCLKCPLMLKVPTYTYLFSSTSWESGENQCNLENCGLEAEWQPQTIIQNQDYFLTMGCLVSYLSARDPGTYMTGCPQLWRAAASVHSLPRYWPAHPPSTGDRHSSAHSCEVDSCLLHSLSVLNTPDHSQVGTSVDCVW